MVSILFHLDFSSAFMWGAVKTIPMGNIVDEYLFTVRPWIEYKQFPFCLLVWQSNSS